MITTIRLNTSELDISFVESVKKLFKNSEIEISIKPVSDNKGSLKYSEDLLQSVKDIENQKNIKTFSLTEFENFSKAL